MTPQDPTDPRPPQAPDPRPPQAPDPRPPGRWLRVVLAMSLALNLAVAGIVAGALLRGGPPHGAAVRDMGFGPYAAALTDEDRAALRRALRSHGPDLRSARSAMREEMTQVAAALRADPFDASAMRAAMERGSGRLNAMIGLGRTLLVDHAASLSAEDRRAMADRLERAGRRGPRDGGERGGRP